jgi:hypothetical protein
LVSIVIGVGNYALTQAKTGLAESTISVLVTALEQYHDFTDMFPPECNDLTKLESELDGSVSSGIHLPEYFSSEALYYYLHKIPESRKIISAIGDAQTTNLDESGVELKFAPDIGDEFSLIRFIDPWEKSLRYEYETGDNFPEITSAGPDGIFNSEDDIVSKGM